MTNIEQAALESIAQSGPQLRRIAAALEAIAASLAAPISTPSHRDIQPRYGVLAPVMEPSLAQGDGSTRRARSRGAGDGVFPSPRRGTQSRRES